MTTKVKRARLEVMGYDTELFKGFLRVAHELGYCTWSWGTLGGIAYLEGEKRVEVEGHDQGRATEQMG